MDVELLGSASWDETKAVVVGVWVSMFGGGKLDDGVQRVVVSPAGVRIPQVIQRLPGQKQIRPHLVDS